MTITKYQLFQVQSSVIRRSVLVFVLMLPGFLLNYALYLGASRILSIKEFGIFYTTISIINILCTPAVFMGFFYTRQITESVTLHGLITAVAEFRYFIRQIVRWGIFGMIGILIFLVLVGSLLGVDSFILLILLSLTVYGNYLVESVRTGLQGLKMFVSLAIASLIWMALRFAFGMYGLFLGETVWSGIAGVMLSTVPVFLIFYWVIVSRTPEKAEPMWSTHLSFRRLVLVMTSFCIFTCLTYQDIILAYLSMDQSELGIYSAASVLPKSIIIVSMPLSRVLFPIIVSTRSVGQSLSKPVLKGFLLTLFVCGAGAGFLILFGELICNNNAISIGSCRVDLMSFIAGSSVPMCLLRVLILLQIARGLDSHPLLLILPLMAYMGYSMYVNLNLNSLALTYFVFSWITLGIYTFACLPWKVISRHFKKESFAT